MAAAIVFLVFLLGAGAGASAARAPAANAGSVCSAAPYPSLCMEALSISLPIGGNLPLPGNSPVTDVVVVATLTAAIAAVGPLVSAFSAPALQVSNRGAADDCSELHGLSVSSLDGALALVRSGKRDGYSVATTRIYLSAALTNRRTCVDGLTGATGPALPTLLAEVDSAYMLVTNALALVSAKAFVLNNIGSAGALKPDQQDTGGNGGYAAIMTVAPDGSGDYTTVSAAVAAAPKGSSARTIINIKAGVYNENVEIPASKTNIVFLGDGQNSTIITGQRSVGDGWTTYRSATLAVAGAGFLARDIGIRNTAGPEKHQAVALRVNADLVAFYRCAMDGYQDTLYAHSFRQFYRECDISGTVDFIFGNAAAVIQGCNLAAKSPMPGQQNMITAQGRDDPNEDTGISIHNCTILAAPDLAASVTPAQTFLGRPWKPYSRTVVMESDIGGLVDPAGWHEWSGSVGLDTLYYGEYDNSGDGAAVDQRVNWPGYHVLDYEDAADFSVANFIYGDEWLDSTSFPYDDNI